MGDGVTAEISLFLPLREAVKLVFNRFKAIVVAPSTDLTLDWRHAVRSDAFRIAATASNPVGGLFCLRDVAAVLRIADAGTVVRGVADVAVEDEAVAAEDGAGVDTEMALGVLLDMVRCRGCC